jgi:ABC-type glycerol-3-phosphate transport system substrate-binding protein
MTTAVLFAGCGTGLQASPPTSAAPEPADTATVPATPAPSPSPENQPTIITLRLWLPEELNPYDRSVSQGYLLRQLASFSSAYPDLSVEVVIKSVRGRGGMLDFLQTAPDVAPSIMPDLMILNADDLPETTRAGVIRPLDDLLPPSAVNDRYAFATEMGQVDGHTMGFVLGVSAQHIAYRANAFAAAPVQWSDVVSATAPFLFPAGGRAGVVNDATLIQYLAAGGSVTDGDGLPHLDRGPLLQVFSFYDRCVQSGVLSPTEVLSLTTSAEAWERFQSSDAALTFVDAGDYRRGADETTAAAPAPTRYGDALAVARGWVITMVAEDPSRQSLAILLLDWLIGPEQNAAWTDAEGYLPGTRSAVMFWDAPGGERIMLSQLLESTRPGPSPGVMAAIGPAIQRGLEAFLTGEATPGRATAIALDALPQ